MTEKLRIETFINLASNDYKAEADRLATQFGNYNLAKKHIEPVVADLKSAMGDVNKIYEEAGLDKPFILNYDGLRKEENNKSLKLDEAREARDAAKDAILSVEEISKQYPGYTYREVNEMHDELVKKAEEAENAYNVALEDFNKAKENKSAETKREYNSKTNNYKYLKELIASKKDELDGANLHDDRLRNKLAIALYSLDVYSKSIEEKYAVMQKAEDVIKEISKSINIDLVYDEDNNLTLDEEIIEEKNNVKEETVEEEKNDVKEETVEEEKTEEIINEETPVEEIEESVEDVKEPIEEIKEAEIVEPVIPDAPEVAEVNEVNEVNTGIGSFDLADEQETQSILDRLFPAGKKMKVTKERWARITPFVHSTLFMAALTSGVFLATGGLSVAHALVGGGLGVGVQALYRKALKEGYVDPTDEMAENKSRSNDPKEISWMVATWHKLSRKILDRKKNKQKNENVEKIERKENGEYKPFEPEMLDDVKQEEFDDLDSIGAR